MGPGKGGDSGEQAMVEDPGGVGRCDGDGDVDRGAGSCRDEDRLGPCARQLRDTFEFHWSAVVRGELDDDAVSHRAALRSTSGGADSLGYLGRWRRARALVRCRVFRGCPSEASLPVHRGELLLRGPQCSVITEAQERHMRADLMWQGEAVVPVTAVRDCVYRIIFVRLLFDKLGVDPEALMILPFLC